MRQTQELFTKFGTEPTLELSSFLARAVQRPHDSRPNLTCCVNTVQKVDVAQRVDELLFLYTNIRLRHQRNKTTEGRIVPSYLPTDYNGDPLGDCSKLLSFRNIDIHTPWASARPNGDTPSSTQNT
jgi:hypothetical protein